MALIKCPECNHEVSEYAISCPNCGYGIKEHFANIAENKTKETETSIAKTYSNIIENNVVPSIDENIETNPPLVNSKSQTLYCIVGVIVCIVIIGLLLSLWSCLLDDGEDFTCGYCGQKMEHYYDYIEGEYTCYSCAKALRG